MKLYLAMMLQFIVIGAAYIGTPVALTLAGMLSILVLSLRSNKVPHID